MVTKRRTRKNQVPLIIEAHPDDYEGYPFITLIQYQDKHILSIIDNSDDKMIGAYNLDLCTSSNVNEENVVLLASDWYDSRRDRYPLSFEFSRLGIAESMSIIYRTYNLDFVTRIIGPFPKFNMNETKSVKRRRRKPIPEGIEIRHKRLNVVKLR